MKYRSIIRDGSCSLILLFFVVCSFAQTKASLEKRRLQIIEQIDRADAMLKKNSKAQKRTLSDLKILDKKIRNRSDLLKTLQQELAHSNVELEKNSVRNNQLNERLQILREKYNKLLNSAYRHHLSYNKWAFILNANSINDSFLRWRYIKQYKALCNASFRLLEQSKQELAVSNQSLNAAIEERKLLIEQQQNQNDLILQEKQEKAEMLESLQSDQSTLKEQLAVQKRKRARLNQAIEAAIFKAFGREDLSSTESYTAKPTSTSAFQRGRLAWPVDNGEVIVGFGKQRHASLRDIMIESNGIDIRVDMGSAAYVVYPGKVVGISKVQGFQNIVIIQHNDYYSVYSKLEKVYLSPGQEVRQGDRIGMIYLDEAGSTVLHFEIWKGKKKLNPSNWLKSKI